MAAKNKHRKKPKTSQKTTFQPEENDVEAENGGEEEDEHSAKGRAKKEDEEELDLDEVLRLGGTQVS